MPGRGRSAPSPTLDHLFVATFVLLGIRLGTVPISDNSAFWHIRTGIDAVSGLGIPDADPYSWTAAGHPWVVQSWLAELVYGAAHRLGGLAGIVALNGLLLGAVAGLTAVLASTGRPRRTLVAAGLAVGVGVGWWSPRPLLFGLVLLGATIWGSEAGVRPRWFLVAGALWVNVHGSFVLGLAWLLLAMAGSALDRRPGHTRPLRPYAARVAALAAGALVGALVSPPGWRLLTFPAKALVRREAFASVIEWQRPDLLAGPVEVLAGLCLAVAAAVLVVARPPLRLVVPAVAFVVAALVSQRNMAVASMALAPALGAGLRSWRPAARTADTGSSVVNRLVAAVIGAAAVVFFVGALRGPALDLADYPVAAVRWMEREGLRGERTRIAHTDVVGGWLILRDGRSARVFIDDRVDMYPEDVLSDYRALLRGGGAATAILRERDVDAVLWPSEHPLAERLDGEQGWVRQFAGGGWGVWVRR